ETVRDMQSIRSAVQRMAKQVKGLGDRSLEISQIVSTIRDIANQTNLLALNAAIEAAGAGEAAGGWRRVPNRARWWRPVMQTARLGLSELVVSRVALGLWQAGAGQTWGADYDESDVIRTIQAAPEYGVTLLDTAPAYGGGRSEELLGQALVGRRERYQLATKLSTNQTTADQVRASVEASLGRLRTDYLDLLQIHWPNTKGEPFEPTLLEMDELRRAGKVRALGVSNFTAPQMAECLEAARIDSLQPPYNLLWRHAETEILPFCRRHEISVVAYSPLAQGLLTGKYHRHNRPADGTRPRNLLWHGNCFETALEVVEVLRRIAAAQGVTPGQVALAWLLHQPGLTSVIAGAKREEQLAQNARAAEVVLSEAELAELAAASEPLRAMTAGEPKMWFTADAGGGYDRR
ncbi:MAG: aldo/keto reductase, partial [Armatimonadetes bacterium]|nr:aldo/keto reductase [Armatimonadota bacterium]